jgi:hypothetical protein
LSVGPPSNKIGRMRMLWPRVADPVLVPAMLAFIAGVLLVASADAFADDEAVTHTRQHALGAVLGATITVAGAAAWQPRWFPARLARYAAIEAFTFFAAAQAVESVGATGYNPTNSSTTLAILLAMIASALVVTTVCDRAGARSARDAGLAACLQRPGAAKSPPPAHLS